MDPRRPLAVEPPPSRAAPPPAPGLSPRRARGVLALAVLACAALLLWFQQVVRDGVAQAETRRQATHAHDAAAWRCQAPRGRPAGADCPPPLDGTGVLTAARR